MGVVVKGYMRSAEKRESEGDLKCGKCDRGKWGHREGEVGMSHACLCLTYIYSQKYKLHYKGETISAPYPI